MSHHHISFNLVLIIYTNESHEINESNETNLYLYIIKKKQVVTKRLKLDFQYFIQIYLSTRAKLSNGEAVGGIQQEPNPQTRQEYKNKICHKG